MKLYEVINRFKGIRGEPPLYTGICPMCGRESLALVVHEDGHREVMCSYECDPGDILRAVGLTGTAMLEDIPLSFGDNEPLGAGPGFVVHEAKPINPINPGGAENEAKWPQPVPLGDDTRLPAFPVDCLPPVARDYAVAIADAVQVSVDMAAVAVLPSVALCVQKVLRIEGKPDWLEPLNLYCMIIAPPAERKSAVAERITRPILEYEKNANELLQYEIDYYHAEREVIEQEIRKAFRGKATVEEIADKRHRLSTMEEKHLLRLWTDNTTPEAAVSLMEENGGRTAIISAEGGIFDIMAGKYSATGADVEVFLKAHAGDSIRVDRKGRQSEYVNRPAMTMLLFAQPVVLDGIMSNDTFRGRGLTARFLYSIPVSKVGQRDFETKPIPQAAEDAFTQMIKELLKADVPENEGVIRLSTEAYSVFADFFRELEPRLRGDLKPIGDWAGKLHGATLRIAGVLHCMEHGSKAADAPVPLATMQNAIAIGRYFLDHALAAYRLMGVDRLIAEARYILHQLEKDRPKQITRTELTRLCRSRFPQAEDMNPALELLVEYGYFREERTNVKANNRRQLYYKLNPKAFGICGISGT